MVTRGVPSIFNTSRLTHSGNLSIREIAKFGEQQGLLVLFRPGIRTMSYESHKGQQWWLTLPTAPSRLPSRVRGPRVSRRIRDDQTKVTEYAGPQLNRISPLPLPTYQHRSDATSRLSCGRGQLHWPDSTRRSGMSATAVFHVDEDGHIDRLTAKRYRQDVDTPVLGPRLQSVRGTRRNVHPD
jgi:hypothetical protein